MELKSIIESAEKQYKQILEEFFVSVYDGDSLFSHGLDHHKRVWLYSRELLELIPDNCDIKKIAAQLIIASYLHDIGMSFDTGIKHGKHSKVLCQLFLSQNNIPEEVFPDLLDAIEKHDDKEYIEGKERNYLLKILSVADDLDAFGHIGIYRYTEIYLTRGIGKDSIGSMILQNSARRFENFKSTFGNFPAIIQKHNSRYIILQNFFEAYNDHLSPCSDETGNPAGYCGIISLFENMIKTNKTLFDLLKETDSYTDPVVKNYFEELKKEIFNHKGQN